MTKDLLTQAAQKEAEGLYPHDEHLTILTNMRRARQRAAHVKCALLYSERAAGLVEALEWIMKQYDHQKSERQCANDAYSMHAEARAALHAFKSQT